MKDVFYEIPFRSTVKQTIPGDFINEKFDSFNVFGYIYLKDSEFGKVEGEISHGYYGHFFISNSYRILLHKGLWILLYRRLFFFTSCQTHK